MFSGVGNPYSILTGMYDYPWYFAMGIKDVFAIQERGISIFATVLMVCLIFALLFANKKSD